MTRLFTDIPVCQKWTLSKDNLPQPSDQNVSFCYRRGGGCIEGRSIVVGQRVWVCKSKGRKQNRSQEEQRFELFERARILDLSVLKIGDINDSPQRVNVQYPKGATYRVRRDHLIPIFDDQTLKGSKLVVVHAETAPYRRDCCIHGCVDPDESFCEIGCAEGVTLQRLRKFNPRNQIIGIDKSDHSIQIARTRLPSGEFVCCDVLETWPNELTRFQPTVVGIDINGNRELDAVLECIQVVMNHWSPRLILVKSRAFYHTLNAIGQEKKCLTLQERDV